MKILIIPKSKNPYQELLYSRLRNENPNDTFSYLTVSRISFFLYPVRFIIKRIQGYNIIHIHFIVFHISHRIPLGRIFSYYYTVICITLPKLLGYKIIWTVHDVEPYDEWTSNYKDISRRLSKLSDRKIIHSRNTIQQMSEIGLDIQRCVLIPHGNFKGVYPDSITPKQARKKLGLKDNDFIILFFGLIRSYKGIDDLITAFSKLEQKDLRLLVAGKCIDESLKQQISKAQKNLNINFYQGHVKDKDVTKYFKAADIICLPFNTITTSGSALLALTLAKPIIAPRSGALTDLPLNVGFFYDPQSKDGLLKSLKLSIEKRSELNKYSKNALNYSETLSWDEIAQNTYNVYQRVLSEPAIKKS